MTEPVLAPYPEHSKPTGITTVLVLLSALGLLTLGLGIRSAIADVSQDRADREERIVADLTSCARGNQFRANLKALAEGEVQYVDDVLDGVLDFAEVEDPQRAVLEELLKPARKRNTGLIETATAPVDCVDVTPGAADLDPVLIPEGAQP